MKNITKKSGFTLIELLVVVLIIGILAAIAVPQYQRTVEKSRAAEAFINVKNMAQKAQMYYMETGTTNLDAKTIDILTEIDAVPSGSTAATITTIKSWQTATFSYLPNDITNLQARRRPEPPSYIISASLQNQLDWGHIVWIWQCQSADTMGQKACESLGGKLLNTNIVGTINRTYQLF